jgi:hypothetical protein
MSQEEETAPPQAQQETLPPGAEEIPKEALNAAIAAAEKEINALPRNAKFLLTLQGLAQNALGELAEEARAAGRLNAAGQPQITPEEIMRDIVAPVVAFLATDIQGLDITTLENMENLLVQLWTMPADATPDDEPEALTTQ